MTTFLITAVVVMLTPGLVAYVSSKRTNSPEYLRGVSFPVNDQDLLRLARSSSHAGASLLYSIERMAEGSYANANGVLRALGMAHWTADLGHSI